MNQEKFIQQQRLRRRRHVRKRVRGTSERPRLTVFRSNQHLYCQVIDDSIGKTLVSASTRDKELRDTIKTAGNCEAASVVGKAIAERATAAGLSKVCLDRGHLRYNGRVAALADAAREGGLLL
ncbi:MAG: 50S ribosomal protein L18 [Pirellulales bacterium]